ncbi:MAG TPA: hypothetical protein VFP56_08240 [Candidatus Limnocylindrales bacterium]|nr:hypothetical protein [Candidatus Limnocylindrales bacterium]
MIGARGLAASPVAWLSAQAILFGAVAAILGVVANAMFLEAFGSGLLPVTYVVIGVAGVLVSTAIRRGAERFDLLRLAAAVLGGASALFLVSWLVGARPDGVWVSGPLLVLFPILIQLGFVFIGGQAGRVLDIAGIKTSFPRIMAGFPIGATIGGLAAVPLVDVLGRVEDLLLVVAIVQGGFAALVWETGRRFARLLTLPSAPPPGPAPASATPGSATPDTDFEHQTGELSLRRLLGRPFIALVLAYQVLSALGSQVADFLVFDRASVLFPGAEDLGRFLAAYTALMNGIAIAFLFLLAGPLLRRHGLRLGIGANPIVDLALALAILVVLAAAGPASVALLGIISAARIADIALTDGMTRTSINALYQVLPARQRLAAQATVEGMGVPLAIGASGVLLLLLNELPIALAAKVVVLSLVCAAWTWVARRLYHEYAPALAAALRSRRVLDTEAPLQATLDDVVLLAGLAAGDEPRAARLAQELAVALPSPTGVLTEGGALARGSRAVALRDVPALRAMLHDGSPEVRRGALDAVQPGDDFAVDAAVGALLDPATAVAAAGAIARLGDAAAPALANVLGAVGSGRGEARVTPQPKGARADVDLLAARMVRAMRTAGPARDRVLVEHVGTPDRSVGLLILQRLAAPIPAPKPAHASLDAVVQDDLEHAVRILDALAALSREPATDPDGVVVTALAEELELVRRRAAAALLARHGRDDLGPALARLSRDAGATGAALAAESLEVTVGRERAGRIAALLAPGLDSSERLRGLRATSPSAARNEAPGERRASAWLVDLAEDPAGPWRSSWLRACATRAIPLLGEGGA